MVREGGRGLFAMGARLGGGLGSGSGLGLEGREEGRRAALAEGSRMKPSSSSSSLPSSSSSEEEPSSITSILHFFPFSFSLSRAARSTNRATFFSFFR